MRSKKNKAAERDAHAEVDKILADLAKVAFANVLDFARFEPDGRVDIFDWEKAQEVGAKVSITTRTIGRGKNAREVRTTEIVMPDKFPALLELGERLGVFERRRKRK